MSSAVKWLIGLAVVGGAVLWLTKSQKGQQIVSTLTTAGLDMIARFEGFSAVPYNDPPGSAKYSIGFGHQIQPGEVFTKITVEEGRALLAKDTANAQRVVKETITRALTPAQFDALTSLVYNIGEGAFKAGTIPAKVNAGNFAAVSDTMRQYIKSGGKTNPVLVARRSAEASAFA